MEEIDFEETPNTKQLKEKLELLVESIKSLHSIKIPSETVLSVENIWDLENVKNASLDIEEKIQQLYKLVGENEKGETLTCFRAAVNMKEVLNNVKFAKSEWENEMTGNVEEEDPNVTNIPAIEFLTEYHIPRILRTSYHIELSEMFDENNKIPVTILTGFLGSGKTTLLNYILKEKHGLKICVIENEFGEQGIDNDLLMNSEKMKTDEIIETLNGCICCTIRKDLIEVINRILKEKKGKFNYIIIESTGVADPSPIISSFFSDQKISMQCKIDSVVTLVDAYHIEEQLSRGENSTVEQIAFADKIILNKIDLLEKKLGITEENEEKKKELIQEEVNRLTHKINKINATTKVLLSSFSKVPLEEILNVRGFDLDKIIELDDKLMLKANQGEKEKSHKKKDKEHHHEHKHQKGNKIGTISFIHEGDANPDKLIEWIKKVVSEHGKDIFRAKGIFAIKNSNNKVAIQTTHEICDFQPVSEWGENEKKISRFVMIGRNLEALGKLEEDFKNCFN